MEFKRLENETDEELIYRVCSQKEAIGTWEDVKDILNSLLGSDFGESTYRKKYQAFQKLMQANEHKFLNDDNYVKELRLERQELKKERIKLQTLNLERNRLDREEARQELFYEQIGQYVQSKQYEKLKPLYVSHERHMKYLLGIADIHANAKWKTMTNEYSMKIVRERFATLLDEVVTFIADKKLDEFKDIKHDLLNAKLSDTTVVKNAILNKMDIEEISYAIFRGSYHNNISPFSCQSS